MKLFSHSQCLTIRIKNMGEGSESNSMRRKKKGTEEKVEQILLENYNRYYRLAFSCVHNEADAGDIVQNGAYRAILNSNSLKHEEYASTWVYRIMQNEIYRFLKTNPSRGGCISLSDGTQDEAVGKEDVYENIDLNRALDAMPYEVKTVIVLKYFEDMKLEEIAEIVGENINTVKSRLYRGLRKLRLDLSET